LHISLVRTRACVGNTRTSGLTTSTDEPGSARSPSVIAYWFAASDVAIAISEGLDPPEIIVVQLLTAARIAGSSPDNRGGTAITGFCSSAEMLRPFSSFRGKRERYAWLTITSFSVLSSPPVVDTTISCVAHTTTSPRKSAL